MTRRRSPQRLLRAVTGADSRLSFAAAGTLVSSMFGIAVRFAVQLALARVMGTSPYGRFVAIRGWSELLAKLPNRGYQSAVLRFLPEYEESGRFGHYRGLVDRSFRLTAVGSLTVAVVAFGVGTVVVGDFEFALLIGFAAIPGWAGIRMVQSVLQAQHQFVTSTLVNEIVQPVVLGLGVLALWALRPTVEPGGALLLVFGSLVVALAIGLRTVRHHIPPPAVTAESEEDEVAWRAISRPLFVSQLAFDIVGMADVLIVAAVLGTTEAALYAIASRIAAIGRVVNAGLASVVSPRISAAWAANNVTAMQRAVDNAISVATPPTLIIAAGAALFATPILGLVGEDYEAASTVLIILLVGNVVNALSGPTLYVISLTGHERSHARVMGVTAVLTVVACLAVAGPWGIVAVAVVRMVIEVFWNAWLVVLARRRLGVKCYPNRSTIELWRR